MHERLCVMSYLCPRRGRDARGVQRAPKHSASINLSMTNRLRPLCRYRSGSAGSGVRIYISFYVAYCLPASVTAPPCPQ